MGRDKAGGTKHALGSRERPPPLSNFLYRSHSLFRVTGGQIFPLNEIQRTFLSFFLALALDRNKMKAIFSIPLTQQPTELNAESLELLVARR